MAYVNTKENAALMLAEVLTEGMGYVIGKASKRYTLWSYNYIVEGTRRELQLHYVHNLSDNRDKVAHKFPGVVIWESLRGNHHQVVIENKKQSSTPSTPSKPKTWEDYTEIPFGKYQGKSIKDITDCDYWCWMANKAQEGESMVIEGEKIDFKPLFEMMAEKTGGEKLFGYYWLRKDRMDKWCIDMRNVSKAVETGSPFSFVADKNDSSFYIGVPIIFKPEDTYEFYTYYGGGRFLVVTDKKGNRKNKRTKGKTIEITSYKYIINEESGRGRIEVESFNIK
jgi:hypothetical protein